MSHCGGLRPIRSLLLAATTRGLEAPIVLVGRVVYRLAWAGSRLVGPGGVLNYTDGFEAWGPQAGTWHVTIPLIGFRSSQIEMSELDGSTPTESRGKVGV